MARGLKTLREKSYLFTGIYLAAGTSADFYLAQLGMAKIKQAEAVQFDWTFRVDIDGRWRGLRVGTDGDSQGC